jgi:hypothetical protein
MKISEIPIAELRSDPDIVSDVISVLITDIRFKLIFAFTIIFTSIRKK